MHSIPQLQSLIAQAIGEDDFHLQARGIEEPVRYFLQIGGKRLRPALVLMATDLFGGDVKAALPAALAIEYYHNFTLIHDDVMDNAPLRRGHQTIHTKWDTNTAILAGDALLVLAYRSLAMCNPAHLPQLLQVFNKSSLEVCEGQQFDLEFEKRDMVTDTEYLQMIRLKTAVLLGAALQMGAILADAPARDAEQIYTFGVQMGIAFQLQDDVLDVYGDMAAFGKQVGGDILADKKTLLLIKAFESADLQQQQVLRQWLNTPSANPVEKVTAVTAIYNELQVRELAEQVVGEHAAEAMRCLDAVGVPDERKEIIRAFASQLLSRQY